MVFAAVLLIGLPFALIVPKSFDAKFYALIAVFFGALGAALATTLYLRRRQQSFEDSLPAPQDLVPELWPHAGARPRPDTGKWSLELLKRLDWRRFEDICAAVFTAAGFEARSTRFGADGSIELSLHAAGSDKPSAMAQCKAWNVYTIGIDKVRELRGAMGDAVDKGVFVTPGTFTEEAQAFARKNRIELIDGAALLEKITAALAPETSEALLKQVTEGDFLTPTCPSCNVKMTWRADGTERRKSWGCVNHPGRQGPPGPSADRRIL
jgi:restriction system protein